MGINIYLCMQAFVFGRTAALTRPLWFTVGFMSFFSIVIALAKVLRRSIVIFISYIGECAWLDAFSERGTEIL
jgi:hypothetical protein